MPRVRGETHGPTSRTASRGRKSAAAVRATRMPVLALAGLAMAAATFFACSESPAATDPHSSQANTINDLWWTMLGMATAIFVLVMALLAVALLRKRRKEATPGQGDPRWGIGVILGGGVVFPIVVLAVLMGLTVASIHSITDEPAPAADVRVIAHDWWWEFRYGEDVVTANELHIPVGQPVRLSGETADVIHSFWVPQLAGKVDLIPGQNHDFTLQADQAGEYRGQCAEFCGMQHAHMALLVVAQDPADYDAWLAQQRQAATVPSVPRLQEGLQLFLNLSCVSCHAVEGTSASARVGPDLTHLASRSTFAAGTVPLTSENLADWIRDPATFKPGAKMPAFPSLDTSSLEALVAYLMSLQ